MSKKTCVPVIDGLLAISDLKHFLNKKNHSVAFDFWKIEYRFLAGQNVTAI